jgi:hypothetical protein
MKSRRYRCVICDHGWAGAGRWCEVCARAWDRQRHRDEGTILAAMNWAARRARRFATRALSHPPDPARRLRMPVRSV